METSARYRLIGAFTLAVIFAGFGFVYWLYNTGGIGTRATYDVEFVSPVTGLLVGSTVLFNGIRVGEVSQLRLDPKNPKLVRATINVELGTPVAPDTAVELAFQGFTSAPAINLVGGSKVIDQAVQARNPGLVLKADPGAGDTMTQLAKRVLDRVNSVVSENSEPLRKLIENLKVFSEALARNADRVDGIVSGIERYTSAQEAARKRKVFDLAAPQLFPSTFPQLPGPLVIEEPTVLLAHNTDGILAQGDGGEVSVLADAKWTDNLPNLVQTKVIASFENAGFATSVARPLDEVVPTHRLRIDVRRFHILKDKVSVAQVEFLVKVQGQSGRIEAAKQFGARIELAGSSTGDAIAGLQTAFAEIINDLVPWVVGIAVTNPSSMPTPQN